MRYPVREPYGANKKRYYQYDEQPLKKLPERAADRPSDEALSWHNDRVFLRSA